MSAHTTLESAVSISEEKLRKYVVVCGSVRAHLVADTSWVDIYCLCFFPFSTKETQCFK